MKNIKTLSILTLLLIFHSCNEKASEEKVKPDGIWKQIGYGNIIELNDSIIKVYDITKGNCDLSFTEEILDFGKIKNFTKDTLTIQHGIDNWLFTRINELPVLCNNSENKLKNDPKHNFNVFWNTFNEHYASFELKGIDWNNVYAKYESRISENTSDLELYTIFREMISLLNDGHVEMEIPEHIEDDYENTTFKKRGKYSPLDEFELNKNIAELYVDSLENYNSGIVRYGIINNNVGYIQINAMVFMANYNVTENLDLRSFTIKYAETYDNRKDEIKRQDEVEGANFILDKIIEELRGVDSYIVDLRFNIGGKDGVALAILNHFSDNEKVVFTKKAQLGKLYTKPQELSVIPSKQKFTKNVYFLTSNKTASASEILVLASLSNSKITRIGSTTQGIFSSTLDKKLPNGWKYQLSNEVYQDLNGKNYENIGITPEYKLEYPKDKEQFFDHLSNELKSGKDSAIELALELEKNKSE